MADGTDDGLTALVEGDANRVRFSLAMVVLRTGRKALRAAAGQFGLPMGLIDPLGTQQYVKTKQELSLAEARSCLQEVAMKKLLSVVTATILGAAFALPLNAAPMFVPKPEQVRADVVETVKQWKKGHGNRHWRNGRHFNNRYAWRNGRHWNNRYALRNCGYYGSCYPRRYYGSPNYYRPYYPGYYPRSGVSIYLNF